jgi:ribosome biogenesis SPOUT family RNA methylase Rps3
LAIRDKVEKVKKKQLKPKIKVSPPLPKQNIIILDPPARRKPRKADEVLRIVDGITDSTPKRAKRAIADIPMPQHNRLQIVPA